MARKSNRPYWRANPEADGDHTPEKTPKHEALHAAVAYLLGYEPRLIRINKDGSGIVDRRWNIEPAWHRAAMHLAPVLIDDLASTDADYLRGINPRSRGYAWRWLKENRRRILRKANEFVSNMGKPGGTLHFKDDGTMKWTPRKKARK